MYSYQEWGCYRNTLQKQQQYLSRIAVNFTWQWNKFPHIKPEMTVLSQHWLTRHLCECIIERLWRQEDDGDEKQAAQTPHQLCVTDEVLTRLRRMKNNRHPATRTTSIGWRHVSRCFYQMDHMPMQWCNSLFIKASWRIKSIRSIRQ